MSIIKRLWRIGKAHFQSDSEKLEEELRHWEEDIKKRGGNKKNQNRDYINQKKFGAEEIADAFRALEVGVGADFETCKKAYHALAKKYHPDLWQGPDKNEIATKVFKLISEAYTRIKRFYGIV